MDDPKPRPGPDGSLLASPAICLAAILLVARFESQTGRLEDLIWIVPLSVVSVLAGLAGTLAARTRWPWLVLLVAGCWPLVRIVMVMHSAMTGHWHAH